VLVDNARDGTARLYTAPQELVIARRPAEVAGALDRIAALLDAGHQMAGAIAYEAGLALEPRLAPLADARCGADGPLVWMAPLPRRAIWPRRDCRLAGRAHARPGAAWPAGARARPAAMPAPSGRSTVRSRRATSIRPTSPSRCKGLAGDALALYAALRRGGGGAHGALVWDGAAWLLSFSPELFFETDAEAITARPMKGTRPRGATPQQDAALAADLAASPKDRAENLMILDLLRNDLARISRPGSVAVEAPLPSSITPACTRW
jgi:para-aminobenzoate synthetase/4-amino-4-deoxychorismate lyase